MSDQKELITKIKDAIETVRPMLQQDGGDVKFVDFDEKSGIVKVEFQGHCVGCPMAQMTLKQGIEVNLKKEVPEVKEVVLVT